VYRDDACNFLPLVFIKSKDLSVVRKCIPLEVPQIKFRIRPDIQYLYLMPSQLIEEQFVSRAAHLIKCIFILGCFGSDLITHAPCFKYSNVSFEPPDTWKKGNELILSALTFLADLSSPRIGNNVLTCQIYRMNVCVFIYSSTRICGQVYQWEIFTV
jgi:hypothetical protein